MANPINPLTGVPFTDEELLQKIVGPQGLAPGLPPLTPQPAVDPNVLKMDPLAGLQTTKPAVPPPEVRNVSWQPSPDFKPLQNVDWNKVGYGVPRQPESQITPLPKIEPEQDMNPEPYVNIPSTPKESIPEQKTPGFWDRLKTHLKTPEGISNLRDIAEGLGGFQVTTKAMLKAGMKPKPFVAEGLRQQEIEARDTMTPQMKAMVEKAMPGVTIPEGMKFSQFEKIAPEFASIIRAQESAKETESRRQASQDEINARQKSQFAEAEKGRQERFQETRSKNVIEERDKLHNKIVGDAHPHLKKLHDRELALDQAEGILNKPGDLSSEEIGLLKTQMPRIEGEVGNLTSNEREISLGIIGMPGWKEKLSLLFGTVTQEKKRNLAKVVTEMREVVRKSREKVREDELKSFTGRYGKELEKEYGTSNQGEQIAKERERMGYQAPGQERVGQTMMYNGKQVRVTKVNPDGTAEVEEIQ